MFSKDKKKQKRSIPNGQVLGLEDYSIGKWKMTRAKVFCRKSFSSNNRNLHKNANENNYKKVIINENSEDDYLANYLNDCLVDDLMDYLDDDSTNGSMNDLTKDLSPKEFNDNLHRENSDVGCEVKKKYSLMSTVLYGKQNRFYKQRFLPPIFNWWVGLLFVFCLVIAFCLRLFKVIFAPFSVCVSLFLLLFALRIFYLMLRALKSKYINFDNGFFMAGVLVITIVLSIFLMYGPIKYFNGPFYEKEVKLESVAYLEGYVDSIQFPNGEEWEVAKANAVTYKLNDNKVATVKYIEYLGEFYVIDMW